MLETDFMTEVYKVSQYSQETFNRKNSSMNFGSFFMYCNRKNLGITGGGGTCTMVRDRCSSPQIKLAYAL